MRHICELQNCCCDENKWIRNGNQQWMTMLSCDFLVTHYDHEMCVWN